MLTTVILPQLSPTSAGAEDSNGNWELSMADGTLNIGVFTDDVATFNGGLAMWRARVPAYIYETTDGTQPNYPPGGAYDTPAKLQCLWAGAGMITSTCTIPSGFSYVNGMAQETCRDTSHVILAFEAMVYAAETARVQGLDLYAEQQKRIVDGFEFAAKNDIEADTHLIDDASAGTVQNGLCGGTLNIGGAGYTLGFEFAYNEYASRLGVSMPNTLAMIDRIRPTAAALHMDYETLTIVGTP